MAVSGGIVSNGSLNSNGSNTGIANGKLNTIRVGYNGYVMKRSKSRGKSGSKVASKNFGRERRDD